MNLTWTQCKAFMNYYRTNVSPYDSAGMPVTWIDLDFADFAAVDPVELLKAPGIGPSTISKIDRYLAMNGIRGWAKRGPIKMKYIPGRYEMA